MSRFFCDTDCELWYTKVKELGIDVLRMPYTINDIELLADCGEEIDFVNFFDQMRKGAVPKTSALNAEDYIDYFEPVLAGGEDILYVHFSEKMSGTFNNMRQAIEVLKEKYPLRTIKYVDTLSISMGAGAIVYEAAKMWKAGKSDDEIIEWVKKNRLNFTAYFLVEKLDYLCRGGRLSTTNKILGNLLGLKPILYINDEGSISKLTTAKGFMKGAMQLIDIMDKIGEDVDKYPIVILDADNGKFADFMEEKIKEKYGENTQVWRQPIGPVIGAHAGPGTISLVFHCKARV